MKINFEKIKRIKKRNEISNLIIDMEAPSICEVGVRTGQNLESMLTHNVKVAVGVDSFKDSGDYGTNDLGLTQQHLDRQYSHVLNKFSKDKRVKIIREYSQKASTFFEDETFDFIYLDADHTYKGISEDLKCWFPKLKVGGILSGHDYIERVKVLDNNAKVTYGVIQAVTEFRKKHDFNRENFHLTQESFASYFIVKEK